MINIFKSLFNRPVSTIQETEAPPVPEHALIIKLAPAPDSLDLIYALERDLRAAIETPGVGEVDGHEVAVNGKDAVIYIYGQDAKALYFAAVPLVRDVDWIDSASFLVRFGEARDPQARSITLGLNDDFETP